MENEDCNNLTCDCVGVYKAAMIAFNGCIAC